MSVMTFQIANNSTVCSTAYPRWSTKKHINAPDNWPFVRGIHRRVSSQKVNNPNRCHHIITPPCNVFHSTCQSFVRRSTHLSDFVKYCHHFYNAATQASSGSRAGCLVGVGICMIFLKTCHIFTFAVVIFWHSSFLPELMHYKQVRYPGWQGPSLLT